MVPEVSDKLDTLLAKELCSVLQEHVAEIRAEHGVTHQEIEDALRVTRTYLSHVLAGRKQPSAMLFGMLDMFAKVPGAFEHATGREPKSSAEREPQVEWSLQKKNNKRNKNKSATPKRRRN